MSTQYELIQQRKEKFAIIMAHLKELEPGEAPDILLAENTKFGIADKLLFEKSQPDKNGIYSNVRLIQEKYNSMKDLIIAIQKHPINLDNKVIIAYQPINDKYHYILLRQLNISKNNIEKYLLLI